MESVDESDTNTIGNSESSDALRWLLGTMIFWIILHYSCHYIIFLLEQLCFGCQDETKLNFQRLSSAYTYIRIRVLQVTLSQTC